MQTKGLFFQLNCDISINLLYSESLGKVRLFFRHSLDSYIDSINQRDKRMINRRLVYYW